MDLPRFLSDHLFWIFIASVPLIIAGQVWFLVIRMSKPENMFIPLPAGPSPFRQPIISSHQAWLDANHLEFVTSFRFGNIEVATYQQRETQRFFSFYFHQQVTFSIETYFDDTECACLDTSTSTGIGMFPQRPRQYQQGFPGISAEDAWRRHLEAEAYLMQRFGIRKQRLGMPYEQVLLKAMRLRMAYVRSLPFYPIRALYWFAVNRARMANKSIQQQYP